MQEMDTTRWAGLMTSYFNERFHRYIWFGPAGAPPLTPNDTLWHLRAQQYYLTAQNVPEEVEKWLSLDQSSHPHLAKWLVINPPINGGESKVFDVLKTYPNLLQRTPLHAVPLFGGVSRRVSGAPSLSGVAKRVPPSFTRTYHIFKF